MTIFRQHVYFHWHLMFVWQEEQARRERENAARRRTLKTIRTEYTEKPSSKVQTVQNAIEGLARVGPHKIKSTWKCGGVKISEVVKKQYSKPGV
jgi:hypothetical protein